MNFRNLLPSRWSGEGRLSRGEPETPFLGLHREMNRLFDSFFRDFDLLPSWSSQPLARGVPDVDVSETDTEVHVEVDLPGLDENDVEVTLADGMLTIRGEKKFEEEKEGKNVHRVERSYGRFERSIPLPADVDENKAEAVFKKGVLTVKLPKTGESASRKKITVTSAD